MKATISIVAVLILIICGITFFTTREYDTGWHQLIPPRTKNEFSKKQAAMMHLEGAYRKLSLDENEKVTIKIQYGTDPEMREETETIFGKDSSEVSIFIYNYPGSYMSDSRKERVTEVRVVDEKKGKTWAFDHPMHYTEGSLLNTGLGNYREELSIGDEKTYFLQISLERERAEP